MRAGDQADGAAGRGAAYRCGRRQADRRRRRRAAAAQSWLPKGEPKAVILGVHGFNDYSNAFAMPAEWWAKHGIATYAYDQRGFGAAPDHGYWPGTATLVSDLRTAARTIKARHPHVPLWLVGDSMGGAVVMVGAGRAPDEGGRGRGAGGAGGVGSRVHEPDRARRAVVPGAHHSVVPADRPGAGPAAVRQHPDADQAVARPAGDQADPGRRGEGPGRPDGRGAGRRAEARTASRC